MGSLVRDDHFSQFLLLSSPFVKLREIPSTRKTPFIFEQLPYVEQFYDYRNFILKMCCSPGGLCYEQPVVAVTTMQ